MRTPQVPARTARARGGRGATSAGGCPPGGRASPRRPAGERWIPHNRRPPRRPGNRRGRTGRAARSLELEHSEAIRDLVPQRGGGVLVQHLMIEPGGLFLVAFELRYPRLLVGGPVLVEAPHRGGVVAELGKRRLGLVEVALALPGVPQPLPGQEPQAVIQLVAEEVVVHRQRVVG